MDPRVAARRQQQQPNVQRTTVNGNGYHHTAHGAPSYNVNSSRASEDSNSSGGGGGGRAHSLTRGDSGFAAASRAPKNVGHLAANGDPRASMLHGSPSESNEGSSPLLDATIRISQGQLDGHLVKKQSDLVQVFPAAAATALSGATTTPAAVSADGNSLDGTTVQSLDVQMRLRRYFAPILVRDDAVASCSQCNSKFGVLRRRVRAYFRILSDWVDTGRNAY